MKNHRQPLRLVHIEQLSHSAKGNPRWKFTARTDVGRLLVFKTASNASSANRCNLSRLQSGDLILATYHQTTTGALVADSWDAAPSKGIERPRMVAVVQLTNVVCVVTKPANPSGDHHG
jgi:hypothetical protein